MITAEHIEDEIANLLGKLTLLHGLDRTEEFIATVALQCAAARREVSVVHIPARPTLRVIQ